MQGMAIEQLRAEHEAVAYNQRLAAEIQAAIDDTWPNLTHDEVMAEMDADIVALPKNKRT